MKSLLRCFAVALGLTLVSGAYAQSIPHLKIRTITPIPLDGSSKGDDVSTNATAFYDNTRLQRFNGNYVAFTLYPDPITEIADDTVFDGTHPVRSMTFGYGDNNDSGMISAVVTFYGAIDGNGNPSGEPVAQFQADNLPVQRGVAYKVDADIPDDAVFQYTASAYPDGRTGNFVSITFSSAYAGWLLAVGGGSSPSAFTFGQLTAPNGQQIPANSQFDLHDFGFNLDSSFLLALSE